jgi:protein-L-isoaspartate(D-aspartate) O-methyltransferase
VIRRGGSGRKGLGGCATALLALAALLLPALAGFSPAPAAAQQNRRDPFAEARRRMVEEQLVERGLTDPLVLGAMARVPRHRFVPDDQRDVAYDDQPLPIGWGQTVHQPYVVGLMTSLLELEPGDKVLEIGTGSGYNTAVLAAAVRKVYTIEIIEQLGHAAEARLSALGYDNVEMRIGDGYQGWAEAAPFDAILLTAAPPEIPQALVRQLKVGGRLVAPVGGFFQNLEVLTKRSDAPGDFEVRRVRPVRVTPMVTDRSARLGVGGDAAGETGATRRPGGLRSLWDGTLWRRTAFTAMGLMLRVSGARDGKGDDDMAEERELMVDRQLRGRELDDRRVLRAMEQVPRHRFVPDSVRERAYDDRPLPIGHGQTISQPYVVALMCSLLDLDSQDRVLEIGTGSGYHAAVLSRLAREVYTIEIVEALGERAAEALREVGYDNVHVRVGDGYRGWPEEAPFDAIVLTAAPPRIPEPLIEQLKVGGRMVLPVGDRLQQLQLLTRTETGVETRTVIPVRFVPMTGEVRSGGDG